MTVPTTPVITAEVTEESKVTDDASTSSSSSGITLLHEVTTSDEYFDEINDNDVAIILFEAAWCDASKSIQDTMNNLSVKYSSDNKEAHDEQRIKFLRVDVDQLTNLASEEKIRGLPTILVYKNKAKVGEVCGANQIMIKTVVDKVFL